MEKGWKQTWENLLFQHFEIEDKSFLEKYLPKDCYLDSFEGKYYIGLVSMQMTNVRHKSTKDFVWFKEYNELNFIMYKPNSYPGLKCRFKEDIERKYKGGLIIFFQSGKINIYRTNNFNEIDYLYKFINKLIQKNFENLIVEN